MSSMGRARQIETPVTSEVPERVSSSNPYRSLDQCGPSDRLFGRDADLVLTLSRITSARTTFLFGGPGVGMSSFLLSKLIPTLESDYRVAVCASWSGDNPTRDL